MWKRPRRMSEMEEDIVPVSPMHCRPVTVLPAQNSERRDWKSITRSIDRRAVRVAESSSTLDCT